MAGAGRLVYYLKKIRPYNIVKGLRYLKHFGLKEFLIRLQERMEPEDIPYGPWYEHYRPSKEELERQEKRNWKKKTLFSVVVPVYRTPETFLREMIDSVLSQTYPFWELCIVNADPQDAAAARVLEEYAKKDERIRVRNLEKNAGIAENTNEGIRMAFGEWICFLDHDDVLSPAALWKFADHLEGHPETDVLYSDEDKIAGNTGEHLQPHLKPDFNPDLLRSNNYICHFLAVRRSLLEKAGLLDSRYDGAQDYDLVLRCSEKAREVGHVPEILYHWRTHEASTADNPVSKMYAYEAGASAIREHLKRCGLEGTVELKKDPGFYRVIYPVCGEPAVSIIVPNRDEAETLRKCISSIREKSTYRNYEILIIENNSVQPETFELYRELAKIENVRILRWKKEFNYSAINNFAAARAKGEYLLFLNNDTEVITPGWIEEMLGTCQRPDTGAVGVRLYYPDDTIQHAGVVIGIGARSGGVAGSMFVGMKRQFSGYMHKAQLMQDLSAVTAACMLVKRSVFEAAGGFDEKLAVAFNDVDLCLRIRNAGYLIVYDPYAELYHYESKSRGSEDTKEKVRRFQGELEYMRSRHTDILRGGDPYYNKNLSLSHWNYSLREGARME